MGVNEKFPLINNRASVLQKMATFGKHFGKTPLYFGFVKKNFMNDNTSSLFLNVCIFFASKTVLYALNCVYLYVDFYGFGKWITFRDAFALVC